MIDLYEVVQITESICLSLNTYKTGWGHSWYRENVYGKQIF